MESILQKGLRLGEGVIKLPKGVFKESVTVDNPCTIVGDGTTLWNDTAPVMVVRSKGVTLRNLKLEMSNVSGYDSSPVVLQVQPDTTIQGVEVYGSIADRPRFYMPRSLHLGEFKSNAENVFRFTILLPTPCEIKVKTSNFKVYTADLGNGYMDLKLVTNPMDGGSMLYGDIVFNATFTRRIFVDGMASNDATQVNSKVLYSYEVPTQSTQDEVFVMPTSLGTGNGLADSPRECLRPVLLQRGQRYPLDYYSISMKLTYGGVPNVEIDPYIFPTGSDDTAIYDDDIVFFGRPSFKNESIRIDEDNLVHFYLDRMPSYVKKVYVCYSIYHRNGVRTHSFSAVDGMLLSISNVSNEVYRVAVNDLQGFSNVVLVEFYQYGGIWKVNPVVRGYGGNLPQLCQHFGIDASY